MPTKTAKPTNNGASAVVETAGIAPITLQPLELETVEIPITGETELIIHRWSEKSKKMMLDKQTGKATPKKPPKDPLKEFEDAKYLLPDGKTMGFPATGFKAAITDAARFFEGVTMVTLKQAIRVIGEGPEQLVQINGPVRMREDTPRNQTGVADLRYRPAVYPWDATLRIRYVKAMLTLEAIVHLVNAAGMGGVGDWRPSSPRSKTGIFGTFRVAEEAL